MGTFLRRAILPGVLLCAACAKERDPVTANQVLEPGDETAVHILTDGEESLVLAIMRDASRVDDPVFPRPAPHGVRWSDVPAAAAQAAAACDMGIVRRESTERGYHFLLLNNRDEPADLFVDRLPPPAMVEASATVGSFAQRPEEAARLAAEFERVLRDMGRRPGFGE